MDATILVRVGAICIAVANVPVVIMQVGGLSVLGGGGTSLREIAPPVILAVIAGLLVAQILLRLFEIPGRGFTYRYRMVVTAFCLGGAIEGELLGWLFTLDGTLGAGTLTTFFAEEPAIVLGNLVWALVPGLVGAMFGLLIGLVEGLVLALPLAYIVRFAEERGEFHVN